jgi:hypothetical protein
MVSVLCHSNGRVSTQFCVSPISVKLAVKDWSCLDTRLAESKLDEPLGIHLIMDLLDDRLLFHIGLPIFTLDFKKTIEFTYC